MLRAEPLARELSSLGIWLLVINGTIGAGIFGLPAEAARLAGGFSPWVFAICAVMMLPVMLSFAELASHFDDTGGPVRYVGSVFGRFAGFQGGWTFYVARLTSFSANASLLVGAVGYFWPPADRPGVRIALLFALCGGLTAVTVVGTRRAIGSLGLLTLAKLLPLSALVVWGLVRIPDSMLAALRVAPPAEARLGAAVLLVFYAFVGFESGLVPAGEARDPRRDMPRALYWALAVVALLYFGLQTVSMAALPDLGSTTRPLVEAAGALLGPAGAVVMMGGVAASVGGNLAGSLFSTARVSYALARDGQLPGHFAYVSPRFGTPVVSIVFYGLAAFVLAAAGSFVWLAGLSVLARLLIYAGCLAALPALRRRAAAVQRAMRRRAGRLILTLALGVCLVLLTQVRARDWLVTGAMLGVGTVLHALARRAGRGGALTPPDAPGRMAG